MLALIDSVIAQNKGKRVVVLTGAEHRHFFDDALSTRNDLNVVNFQDILPLKEYSSDKAISDYITKDLARYYYDTSGGDNIDLIYQGAIISLTHGINMDDNPSIIPKENIGKAETLVEDWKKEKPTSAYATFELGWITFLKGDYQQAIDLLSKISNRLDEIPESMQWFIKPFYYRNFGFCLDRLGRHDEAVEKYKEGIAMCKQLKLSDDYIKSAYKDYIAVPYDGKQRK